MAQSPHCPTDTLRWLLASDEPWTRYRTLVDLLDRPEDMPEVADARAAMLSHPQVQALMASVAAWPGYALRRHNDASHPLHQLATLADFGVRHDDAGFAPAIETVMARQSPDGAFLTLINIPKAYGGSDEDMWTWALCDAPTLLYALLKIGLHPDSRVQRAVEHLVGLAAAKGWRCTAAPELGKFRGPGRQSDPCPIANVYALKALAQVPQLQDCTAARAGAEMLLGHWQHQRESKFYMFGIGTDFRKLKYPFVWYDILHVVDVLSQFPSGREDERFRQMVETITAQVDAHGRCTPNSMYRSWAGWSFADKKRPSPWLTFLVQRILKRVGG
jgi:hypothetical protein